VGGADEVFLAYVDVMHHLTFDIPPDPYYDEKNGSGITTGMPTMNLTCEYPDKNYMCRITILPKICYISENELVEAFVTGNCAMDGCHRKKNGPGYEPDWQHDADHHAQETEEKVAVQSIGILDLGIIRVKDRSKPSQEARRYRLLSLPTRK